MQTIVSERFTMENFHWINDETSWSRSSCKIIGKTLKEKLRDGQECENVYIIFTSRDCRISYQYIGIDADERKNEASVAKMIKC